MAQYLLNFLYHIVTVSKIIVGIKAAQNTLKVEVESTGVNSTETKKKRKLRNLYQIYLKGKYKIKR